MNIFPSEYYMRNIQSPVVSHVSEVESGLMGLMKTARDDTVSPCPFVRVKSLFVSIEEIMNKNNFKMVEHEQFRNKIWLLFSGDKGGSHM